MEQFKTVFFVTVLTIFSFSANADLGFSGGSAQLSDQLAVSNQAAQADIQYIQDTCAGNPNQAVCANAQERIAQNRAQIERNNQLGTEMRSIFGSTSTEEAIEKRTQEASLKKCLYAAVVACSFVTSGGDGGMAYGKVSGRSFNDEKRVLQVNDSQPIRTPGSDDD